MLWPSPHEMARAKMVGFAGGVQYPESLILARHNILSLTRVSGVVHCRSALVWVLVARVLPDGDLVPAMSCRRGEKMQLSWIIPSRGQAARSVRRPWQRSRLEKRTGQDYSAPT